MTRAVAVLLGTGALLLAPAGARQPPRVTPIASADVADNKPGLVDCAGLAFLPDGERVVARWERYGFGNEASDGRLVVVGPRGEKAVSVAMPVADYFGGVLKSGFAVTRAGEVLAVERGTSLLLLRAGHGPIPAPARRVVLTNALALLSRVWLAGQADGLFALRSGDKTAYQLVTVDGSPLTEGKGRTRQLLEGGRGGVVGELVLGADLHPSGRWFAAALSGLDGVGDGRLDVWQLGDVPRKQSVPLKVYAFAASFAPDGKTVALGLADGSVAFRATADLAERRAPVEVGRFTVAALAHHPRGPFVACGTLDSRGGDNLAVVRTDTGAVVRRLPADPNGVQAVCFNATGTRLATFGGRGRVAVWDTSDLAAPKE